MILLIDNYDSFSYNLYQLIGTINPDIRVIRNDELTVAEIKNRLRNILFSHRVRADQKMPECALTQQGNWAINVKS